MKGQRPDTELAALPAGWRLEGVHRLDVPGWPPSATCGGRTPVLKPRGGAPAAAAGGRPRRDPRAADDAGRRARHNPPSGRPSRPIPAVTEAPDPMARIIAIANQEGRSRQDHHRGQPRRGAGRHPEAGAADRPRRPGQRDQRAAASTSATCTPRPATCCSRLARRGRDRGDRRGLRPAAGEHRPDRGRDRADGRGGPRAAAAQARARTAAPALRLIIIDPAGAVVADSTH